MELKDRASEGGDKTKGDVARLGLETVCEAARTFTLDGGGSVRNNGCK